VVGAQRMKCLVLVGAARHAEKYGWTRTQEKCGKPATRAFLRVRPINMVMQGGAKSVLPGTLVTTCEEHAEMYISSYTQGDGMFREIGLDEALVYEVQTG